MNKVIICGNLGQDPDVRATSGGNPVVNLSVATNYRVKRNDQWVDEVEWHRVTVWGKQADACGRYLAKGRKVLVEGRLQTRKWKDGEGRDRYTTEVVAERVEFVGGRDDGGHQQGRQQGRQQGHQQGRRGGHGGGGYGGGGYGGRDSAGGMDIDEIPF